LVPADALAAVAAEIGYRVPQVPRARNSFETIRAAWLAVPPVAKSYFGYAALTWGCVPEIPAITNFPRSVMLSVAKHPMKAAPTRAALSFHDVLRLRLSSAPRWDSSLRSE
jgi:hypothetical protein